MKVLILTEGGKRIGLGHISRCSALAEEFFRGKASVKFVMCGDKMAGGFCRSPNMEPDIFDWKKKMGMTRQLADTADVVVIDSYLAGKNVYQSIYAALNRGTKKSVIVYLDDFNRLKYPPGIILNPSFYGKTLPYNTTEKAPFFNLLGKEYIILRKAFRTVPEKRIKKKIKDVLIILGGGGRILVTKKIIKFLSVKDPGISCHIVSSAPEGGIKANCDFYPNVSAMALRNLMLDCDLCISGGGQTLYELIRVGVPSIGICVAENQKGNLKICGDRGLIKDIGWYNDKNLLERLDSAYVYFSPREKRVEYSNIGRVSVDGKGVQRIVEKIAQCLNKC